MNKKTIVILLIAILIVSTAISYTLIASSQPFFSDDPTDYIDKSARTKTVNIEKATVGQGRDVGHSTYWAVNGTVTAFQYEGFYQGTYFKDEYRSTDNVVRMHIGPDMKPNDGIIEGVAIERITGEKYEILIFVDEDWRQSMPQTTIVWGRTHDLTRGFRFTEISPGIYMDTIEDDPSRFSYNHLQSESAIVIGKVTQKQVQEGNTEGITAIIFQ
jgi:hypothetical protein